MRYFSLFMTFSLAPLETTVLFASFGSPLCSYESISDRHYHGTNITHL